LRYKCHNCLIILEVEDLVEKKCPMCNISPKEMCPEDKICNCSEEITGGTQLCPTCGEFTCPCGSHDCSPQSRITGYIGALSGWNQGKVSEFLDRVHYKVA